MLHGGVYASVGAIADAENISKSYVSRILRLALLMPDVVERNLDGCPALLLAELMQPFPVGWERQRTPFA